MDKEVGKPKVTTLSPEPLPNIDMEIDEHDDTGRQDTSGQNYVYTSNAYLGIKLQTTTVFMVAFWRLRVCKTRS